MQVVTDSPRAAFVPARASVAGGVLLCFALQLLTALTVIPPWQNPDEPQHVMTVRQVLTYGSDFSIDKLDPAAEQAIVRSMAEYGWWQHYGRPTPQPLPSTFAEGPAQVVQAYFGPPDGGSRLYYRFVAWIFRTFGVNGLLTQLYTMRGLSIVAALVALACVWAGMRVALGFEGALAAATAVTWHPQFIIVSASATPDALVNLAAAIVWWQSALLLFGSVGTYRLGVVWGAAIAAFLLRRVGGPLLLIALLTTAAVLWSRRTQLGAASWGTLVASAAGIVFLVTVAVTLTGADFARASQWVVYDPMQAAAGIIRDSGRLPAFAGMLFTTFWLSAGWLRYPGGEWWQAVTVVMAVMSAVGVLAAIARRQQRRLIVICVAMIGVQLAAVVALYFGILRVGPQGRYLFPVLAAAACLLWIGWAEIFRWMPRRAAAVSFMLLMACLNVSAWLWVVFPAYL
jgi:hypothetical protein